MRILINATGLRGGGGETFLLGLLPELLKMDVADEYTLIIPESRRHIYGLHDNLLIIPIPDRIIESSLLRFWHEHSHVVSLLRQGCFDVFFQADEMLSPLASFLGIPSMIVMHTTAHKIIPKQIGDSPVKLFYLNGIKAIAMRRANVIIAVSHHAKGELSGLYPSYQDRIRVIYHGINHELFMPFSDKPAPLKKLGIDQYFLSVSDRHTHKNYCRLIKAYTFICKKNILAYHLILVGRPKNTEEEKRITAIIAAEGLEDRVHLLEYVKQEELAELYRGAAAYIFPSTFETFGFTPLEAMACGVPVACAWCSAMPEICGDAVEYFDPMDVADMVRAIEVVLWETKRRESLVQIGERHVSAFTWRRAAEQYRRALSEIGKRIS